MSEIKGNIEITGNLDEIKSEVYRVLYSWNNAYSAAIRADRERKEYEAEEDNENRKVLEILDKLGFPMDNLGTYLFKDVVLKVCPMVGKFDLAHEKEYAEKVSLMLNNPVSNFNVEIARNDLGMGAKTFRNFIDMAMKKADCEKADSELVKEIYGDSDVSYGLGDTALKIALYLDKLCKVKEKTIDAGTVVASKRVI